MLDEARTSVAQRAWDRAYELFSAVAATGTLIRTTSTASPRPRTGRALRTESISLREAAYAAYLERGDDERAALCALTLQA